MSLRTKLSSGVTLLHSENPKPAYFTYNTEVEYRIGYYLWSNQGKKNEYILDARWVQDSGDFTIGKKSFELKENRGSLHSGEISLEVLDTKKAKVSGLTKSYQDKVDYFSIYLPTYDNYRGRYDEYVDNLLIMDTKKLYEWVIQKEELAARNNKFLESNALCFKIPVNYITDSASFQELIIKRVHIPEDELRQIDIPEELYQIFQDE